MAKTLEDVLVDLDRNLSYALHCALDDAATGKVPNKDAEVVCLQAMSSALCTLAFVCGMSKEGFLDAIGMTWDLSEEAAEKTAAQVAEILNMAEKKEEEQQKSDSPVELPDLDLLKN